MSTVPVPVVPPTTADVQTMVDLMTKAKSSWGLFSALTSKKACVSITAAAFLFAVGLVALKYDVWAGLWFFGLGTAQLSVWVVAQAAVDCAQQYALSKAAVLASVIKAEED